MEAVSLHTGTPKVHWEDNTTCNSFVEATRVTNIVKHIYITVCLIKEQNHNGIFVPKYENYSGMPEYMCTKPCSCPIISSSTKWITGFIFYPTIDT